MAPFTLRWGIMATGGIAQQFTKDLLTNPAIRDVHDVAHKVVAVGSSSSKDSAASFLEKTKTPEGAKTYGSYAELVQDADVDIIYVATPHSHHFQNAMMVLSAGKHCLCEKALTVNASQARKLVEKAKEQNVFFMEAVWTRYQPLSVKVRELVQAGTIGPVHRVIADLSFNFSKNDGSKDVTLDEGHRLVNMDLAGGALLDLGIYSLTWVFQILYHLQPEAEKEAPNIVAASNKYKTGADESTCIIAQFPKHGTMGIATTSFRVPTNYDQSGDLNPCARIQGPLGEIHITGMTYKPTGYKVVLKDNGGKIEVVDCPVPKDEERDGWGLGMFWEADECARCIRDGKKESSVLPWSESITIMDVMESVLRQGGVEYPDLITTDKFDPKSPLNTGGR